MAMDIVSNTSEIDDESYQIRKSESESRMNETKILIVGRDEFTC
jgi:hypothetical protein